MAASAVVSASDLGNNAERREARDALQLLGRRDGIVELLEDVGGGEGRAESQRERQQERARKLGDEGAPGSKALSTMKMLLVPTPPAMSTSLNFCSSPL